MAGTASGRRKQVESVRRVQVARCLAGDVGVAVLPDDPVSSDAEEDDAVAVVVVDGDEAVSDGECE